MAQVAARPALDRTPAQATAARRPAPPATYVIKGVRVEGVEGENMQRYVRRTSGLEEGQEVTIPGGQSLAEAVRALYDSGVFSDVTIMESRTAAEDGGAPGVVLTIKVQPEPGLAEYTFRGIRKKHRDDLKKAVPLLAGRPARPSQIARAEDVIENFYKEKGYLLTEVDVVREEVGEDEIALTFNVDRGEKVEVEDISFEGNAAFSDRKLRGQLENTKEDRWWRFWKGEAYKENEYEEDLENVIAYYREKGYYDARIVRDSVYLVSDDGVGIDVRVEEGDQYHIRNVTWEGNTVYPDRVLTQSLGFEKGDVFNTKKLDQNLRGPSRRSSDVSSLYLNRGYLQFDVRPEIRAVGGDSLDLVFDVSEGEVYEVGTINIAGNTKTKEHVIRRELYTVPGQTFSRQDIQESIRRLQQLSYFSQESLVAGPGISVDDERKKVDLTYTVEEVGSDQLELSGTYGGYGIVLQLRFSFNNFSIQNIFNWDAYKPLPAGDGQKLSVGIQTNGRFYQNFSLSFTEPWFRGRPTPIGGSASFSRISRLRGPFGRTSDNDDGFLTQLSTRFFYQQRLKWPDDKFTASSAVGYRFYNNQGLYDSRIRPDGISQEVTFEQGFERNSLNNPLFPSNGSKASLTLELAPPIDRAFGVNDADDRQFIQYHKWRFQTSWNAPLSEKISLNVSTDYGYIGSLTGEEVQFERFEVGGSPFDYNGFSGFGADPVFTRGYPARSIGPRQTLRPGEAPTPIGGRILNKYSSEVRWLAVQSQQLQAQPYLFLDAANTWRDFDSFSPANLYRSAGVGARLFLPIVGLIEISYGYNFDRYQDLDRTGVLAPRDWTFQFTLGQGFGQ